MKKTAMTILSAVVLSAGLFAVTEPASALGGCGRNFHRGPYGGCRFGGQNEHFCLRHTGHVAGRGPYGGRFCAR